MTGRTANCLFIGDDPPRGQPLVNVSSRPETLTRARQNVGTPSERIRKQKTWTRSNDNRHGSTGHEDGNSEARYTAACDLLQNFPNNRALEVPLDSIPYIDHPEMRIDKHESTEMPFRYMKNEHGKPIMPEVSRTFLIRFMYISLRILYRHNMQGMIDLIKQDAEKGFGDLF